MTEPLGIACSTLALVGTVINVTTWAIGRVDMAITAHEDHRRGLRDLRHELHKTLQGTANMHTVLRVMFGDSQDKMVRGLFKEYVTSQTYFLTPVNTSFIVG